MAFRVRGGDSAFGSGLGVWSLRALKGEWGNECGDMLGDFM